MCLRQFVSSSWYAVELLLFHNVGLQGRKGCDGDDMHCSPCSLWWRNEGTRSRDDHRWRTRFNCVQTAMKLHHWPAHWRRVSRCLSFSHWPTAIHDPCIVCHIAFSNGFVEHSIKDASAVCVRVCFVFRAAYFLLALHCCRLFRDFCFNEHESVFIRIISRRILGGPTCIQTLRCTTGPTSSQFCSMGVRHWPSPRPWPNASMPSTPDVCVIFCQYHTPGILLQMRQFGASQAVRQSLKGKMLSTEVLPPPGSVSPGERPST